MGPLVLRHAGCCSRGGCPQKSQREASREEEGIAQDSVCEQGGQAATRPREAERSLWLGNSEAGGLYRKCFPEGGEEE